MLDRMLRGLLRLRETSERDEITCTFSWSPLCSEAFSSWKRLRDCVSLEISCLYRGPIHMKCCCFPCLRFSYMCACFCTAYLRGYSTTTAMIGDEEHQRTKGWKADVESFNIRIWP